MTTILDQLGDDELINRENVRTMVVVFEVIIEAIMPVCNDLEGVRKC